MTYNAADNSAKSYALAIDTMREKLESFHRVQIGDCTLYQGDCREILPLLPKVDAVVTDPPYGIDFGKGGGFSALHGWGAWRDNVSWDKERPTSDVFTAIINASNEQIVWGGNYFSDYLPPSMRWLIWDKGQRGFSLADFEMAWTSQNKASRIFTYGRGNEKGFAPGSKEALKHLNAHPTQKPLEVMRWCLGFVPDARTILDPFMGSGTTGVACVKLGRKFSGIEIEPKYFEIACKRIEQAYAQPDFFVEAPQPKAEQLNLLGAAE